MTRKMDTLKKVGTVHTSRLFLFMSPLGTNWGRNLLGLTIIHLDTNRMQTRKTLIKLRVFKMDSYLIRGETFFIGEPVFFWTLALADISLDDYLTKSDGVMNEAAVFNRNNPVTLIQHAFVMGNHDARFFA